VQHGGLAGGVGDAHDLLVPGEHVLAHIGGGEHGLAVEAPVVVGHQQAHAVVLHRDAIVFRDGVRIDGIWRTDGTHPPILEDLNGNIIYLKPGKTWFQVPRDIYAIVVKTGHPELDDPSAAVSEEQDLGAVEDALANDD